MRVAFCAAGLVFLSVISPANADDATLAYQFTCSGPGAVEATFPFDGTQPTTQFFTSYGRGPYLLQLFDLHAAGDYWNVIFQPVNKSQGDISFSGMHTNWQDLFIKGKAYEVSSIRITNQSPAVEFEIVKDEKDYKFQYVMHILSDEGSTRDYNIRYGKQTEAHGFVSTITGRCVRDTVVRHTNQ